MPQEDVQTGHLPVPCGNCLCRSVHSKPTNSPEQTPPPVHGRYSADSVSTDPHTVPHRFWVSASAHRQKADPGPQEHSFRPAEPPLSQALLRIRNVSPHKIHCNSADNSSVQVQALLHGKTLPQHCIIFQGFQREVPRKKWRPVKHSLLLISSAHPLRPAADVPAKTDPDRYIQLGTTLEKLQSLPPDGYFLSSYPESALHYILYLPL